MQQNNYPSNLWNLVETELKTARQARSTGNEGKARVCARRAAGKAVSAAGLGSFTPLVAIQNVMSIPDLPAGITSACCNLLKTVDDTYQLDEGIDLISDSETLVKFLMDYKQD
ncbi:MAG TPA: hypothetical protein VF338_12030 [Leptolinea sp.]